MDPFFWAILAVAGLFLSGVLFLLFFLICVWGLVFFRRGVPKGVNVYVYSEAVHFGEDDGPDDDEPAADPSPWVNRFAGIGQDDS